MQYLSNFNSSLIWHLYQSSSNYQTNCCIHRQNPDTTSPNNKRIINTVNYFLSGDHDVMINAVQRLLKRLPWLLYYKWKAPCDVAMVTSTCWLTHLLVIKAQMKTNNNTFYYTALQNVPKSTVDLNGPSQRSQVNISWYSPLRKDIDRCHWQRVLCF